MLIHSEEQDGVHLFVVDQKEERMVGLELRVEQRPSGAEAEEGGGGRSLAPLLIDLDEGLVLGGVQADRVLGVSVLVHEPGEVGPASKQRVDAEAAQRLKHLDVAL